MDKSEAALTEEQRVAVIDAMRLLDEARRRTRNSNVYLGAEHLELIEDPSRAEGHALEGHTLEVSAPRAGSADDTLWAVTVRSWQPHPKNPGRMVGRPALECGFLHDPAAENIELGADG